MLNVLLSFAQFEREIISERTRDKIAAMRRKGKWAGGRPLLGYDVDRSGPSPKLVVNAEEAARVREIFQLYLTLGSMLPVVEELARARSKNSTDRKALWQSGFERISEFASRPKVIVIARWTGGFDAISIARRVRQSLASVVSSPGDGSHAALRW